MQLASEIQKRKKTNPGDPYASNWLERLRQIQRLRAKIGTAQRDEAAAQPFPPDPPPHEDFTQFV